MRNNTKEHRQNITTRGDDRTSRNTFFQNHGLTRARIWGVLRPAGPRAPTACFVHPAAVFFCSFQNKRRPYSTSISALRHPFSRNESRPCPNLSADAGGTQNRMSNLRVGNEGNHPQENAADFTPGVTPKATTQVILMLYIPINITH